MRTPSGLRRSLQVAAGTTVLVASMAIPVAAAPPGNDDRANATVIGSAPYQVTLDTTDATPQAGDPDCATGPDDPTVWFSFTPAQAGTYGVSTVGSDYDTTLVVATPGGGGLDIVDCNDDAGPRGSSVILWDAVAGQEYLIMAGSCCGSPGGQLELALRRDPTVPRVRVSVAPRGTVNGFGAAVIHGRLECFGGGGRLAFLDVNVRQRAGRFIIRGDTGTDTRCGQRWKVRVPGGIGIFKPGVVPVRVSADGCGTFGCGNDIGKARVRLTRAER
jgi:hypothetical protein